MANMTQDVVSLAKKKQASKTWMLLDDKGDTMLLEVDKYAIMHRVGIHARDLRILDPLLSYPSTILGRERAVVLNLEVGVSCPVPSGFHFVRGSVSLAISTHIALTLHCAAILLLKVENYMGFNCTLLTFYVWALAGFFISCVFWSHRLNHRVSLMGLISDISVL
jgi:hypothetical protein